MYNGPQISIEEEKSTFERFEADVKQTIYDVLYVLLKDEESSAWKDILIIFTDHLQIYAFTFTIEMEYPWKSDSTLVQIQTFFDYFNIAAWLGQTDITTFYIIFYSCIFIVCLVILDVCYVSYSFKRKKFAFVWPLKLLRSVCGLLVTALFLPLLDVFTTMIHCQQNLDDGLFYMVAFTDEQCWHGKHIMHASFAVVVSAIFITFSLIVSLTFFESKNGTKDLTARVNSRADTFLIVEQIILQYVLAFLVGPQYQWHTIVVLLIVSWSSFQAYRSQWPYYNDKMNRYICALTALFFWENLCLLIAKLLQHTQFDGAIQLYLIGLPLVAVVVYFDKDERTPMLLRSINTFQKGEDYAQQIRYYLHLVQTRDTNRRNAILLEGYIHYHEENCPLQDCQLKLYTHGKSQGSDKSKGRKKKLNPTGISQDQQKLLIQHARNMYRLGLSKFSECTQLKIQYSFFLMETMGKQSEAMAELSHAKQFNPPFDDQFVIYRYQKMSEDYGDNSGEAEGGKVDVIAKLAFESNLRQCNVFIEKSAALHLEFWNHLCEDRPDIMKLNSIGSKINQSIIMVESYWSEIQKLNANVPKALKLYGKFLVEILNDKESGMELIEKAKESTNQQQNQFEHQAHELGDINQVSSNGTPCIFVAGDNENCGIVTQCNASACKIFGFSKGEIINHNVEKLMPQMYARHHAKILEDAQTKGEENISNKERIIFARHKSSYIFPTWIQLKQFTDHQGQIQFIALFKIDKKHMSSTIAYILVDSEKKIQSISSSCMHMMDLDANKMRSLSTNGISIKNIMPQLFDQDEMGTYLSKQGAKIEWHQPDIQPKPLKVKGGNESNDSPQKIANNERLFDNKTGVSKEKKLKFNCNLSTVSMGIYGEIGWCVKLEQLAEKHKSYLIKQKGPQKVKQMLFQFRFDPYSGKFIREIKENYKVENAASDPAYLRKLLGEFTLNPASDKLQNVESEISDSEEESPPKLELKTEQSETENLFKKKKRWAEKITTYRLVNGNFLSRDSEEEANKLKQIEEEAKKNLEKEEKVNQTTSIFKNGIKSRKKLYEAINDKTTPRAIKNLNLTMNLVMLALLAIAIADFSFSNQQFEDINENFNLIQQSYARISEFQRIGYGVRTLIMINEKKQTTYKNYTTEADFTEFLLQDIDEALGSIYYLQNVISLSQLSTFSSEQEAIQTGKHVPLYFREGESHIKTMKFSLNEAVLQLASAIFTVRHMNVTSFTENQEDLYFITYNIYNDFLEALRKSSKCYVDDLHTRTNKKNELILILFLASIATVVLTMVILLPVISNVNIARIDVLTLFIDIPSQNVIDLVVKCEQFLESINDEEDKEDEIRSEQGEADKIDEQEQQVVLKGKRGYHKHPKNFKGSNTKTFIQFGSAGLVVFAYFATMYVLSNQNISNTEIISKEMNILAQAESYYSFALNVQIEMLYNPEKKILKEDSFTVAEDTIEQVYKLNKYIKDYHFSNRNFLRSEYNEIFTNLYQNNLCQYTDKIKFDMIPFECEEFMGHIPQRGLQSVLARYFETLRETLKTYAEYQEAGKKPITMINSNTFLELYIIQFRFIQDSFRSFVDTLKEATSTEFTYIVDTRIIAFIIFVIVLGMAYLVLWLPFVNLLNKEIWRTKSMLTIIPIEVIVKIPRIQEFLENKLVKNTKKVKL